MKKTSLSLFSYFLKVAHGGWVSLPLSIQMNACVQQWFARFLCVGVVPSPLGELRKDLKLKFQLHYWVKYRIGIEVRVCVCVRDVTNLKPTRQNEISKDLIEVFAYYINTC